MSAQTAQTPTVITPGSLIEQLKQVPLASIIDLDFVKKKYIDNYNACNPQGDGELMYHRNLVFIKQAISNFKTKEGNPILIDPFSVYACITTMAVDGISAAPDDEEVYLYPFKGVMYMQKQAGAHVNRLVRSGQIANVLKVDLVYKGDVFEVEDGFVKKHISKFGEDVIIAGYIKFLLPNGQEKHFVYRPFDWESWRSHSPQQFGENWRFVPPGSPKEYVSFQPKPGFLKTKIISHACKEKSWTTGRRPVTVEIYANVYREAQESDLIDSGFVASQVPANEIPPITPHEDIKPEQVSVNNNVQPSSQPASKPPTEDEDF